jgi:hypothetical protein
VFDEPSAVEAARHTGTLHPGVEARNRARLQRRSTSVRTSESPLFPKRREHHLNSADLALSLTPTNVG